MTTILAKEKAIQHLKSLAAAMTMAIALTFSLVAPTNAATPKCRFAWSHYTGWEVMDYLQTSGILAKYAAKHGVEIEIVLVNDYIESITQFTVGAFCGVTATNMETLTIPAIGGVDTTALIIGDFSNGNDGILFKNPTTEAPAMRNIAGLEVMLEELSVSHYLLARALEMSGMSESDITVVNTSDADIGTLFASGSVGTTVVTWNPILMSARNEPGATVLFDSSQIPGEIIDMVVVRTDIDDAFKKALAGAWYEAMSIMTGRGQASKDAIAHMAAAAGGTVPEFMAQLRTTAMFYNPADAAAFARSEDLKETMEAVRTFLFDHGLYGTASSADEVGIQFPDGSVMGDSGNVMMRFDATFMEMAAKGVL